MGSAHNMKLGKFLTFAIAVISMAVVIFNNIMQLKDELFGPTFNLGVWIGFGIVTLVTTSYLVYNWNSR
jgi:hypothetical protein